MEESRSELLSGFDPEFYVSQHEDLRQAYGSSKNLAGDLFTHFLNFGAEEGRIGSRMQTREAHIELLQEKSVLEIGSFLNPCLIGKKVKYFDVLNRDELRERAKIINYDAVNIVDIDFVEKMDI